MDAMQQRKPFLKLYQNRSKNIKDKLGKTQKEDKQKEKAKQCAESTAIVLKVCGMCCTSIEHVEELKQKAKSSR